jgi:hypothetical protein
MNEVNKKSDSSKRQNRIKILHNEKSCKNNLIFGSNFKIENFVSGSEDKALAASTESLEGRVESPDVQDNFFFETKSRQNLQISYQNRRFCHRNCKCCVNRS